MKSGDRDRLRSSLIRVIAREPPHRLALGALRRARQPLARIPHGSGRPRTVHDLGLRVRRCCSSIPASAVRQALDDPLAAALLIGVAMGLTAIAIIYSPLGQTLGRAPQSRP